MFYWGPLFSQLNQSSLIVKIQHDAVARGIFTSAADLLGIHPHLYPNQPDRCNSHDPYHRIKLTMAGAIYWF